MSVTAVTGECARNRIGPCPSDVTGQGDVRQQPSKVPITLSRRKMAGSKPTAHHHLSLIAAQRNATGDARLIRTSARENGLSEGAHEDGRVLNQISITKPVTTAARPAIPSFRSVAHEDLVVIFRHSTGKTRQGRF